MVTYENKIHIQSCMSTGLWCPAQRQTPARGQHRQQHKEVATAGPINSVDPCRRATLWVSFTGGGSGGRRPRPVRPEVLRRRDPTAAGSAFRFTHKKNIRSQRHRPASGAGIMGPYHGAVSGGRRHGFILHGPASLGPHQGPTSRVRITRQHQGPAPRTRATGRHGSAPRADATGPHHEAASGAGVTESYHKAASGAGVTDPRHGPPRVRTTGRRHGPASRGGIRGRRHGLNHRQASQVRITSRRHQGSAPWTVSMGPRHGPASRV